MATTTSPLPEGRRRRRPWSSCPNNNNNNDDDDEEEEEGLRIVETSSQSQQQQYNNNNNSHWMAQWLQHLNPVTHCLSAANLECGTSVFPSTDILEVVEESLLPELSMTSSRDRALQQLYRATDREHPEQRIAVICTTRFNLIQAMIPACLFPSRAESSASSNSTPTTNFVPTRRWTLMVLNNLCIPHENRAALLLGDHYQAVLLPALLHILQRSTRCHETSYLAAACLYNLSFLPEGKFTLFYYVPPPSTTVPTSPRAAAALPEYRTYPTPLYHPQSLFSTCVDLLHDFLPVCWQHHQQQQHSLSSKLSSRPAASVEEEAIRWTLGLMRNLIADRPEHAMLLWKNAGLGNNSNNKTPTDTNMSCPRAWIFVQAAIQSLRTALDQEKDLCFWKSESIEDISLLFLLQLVKPAVAAASASPASHTDSQAPTTSTSSSSKQQQQQRLHSFHRSPSEFKTPPQVVTPSAKLTMWETLQPAVPVLQQLQGRGGIHETRAMALIQFIHSLDPTQSIRKFTAETLLQTTASSSSTDEDDDDNKNNSPFLDDDDEEKKEWA